MSVMWTVNTGQNRSLLVTDNKGVLRILVSCHKAGRIDWIPCDASYGSTPSVQCKIWDALAEAAGVTAIRRILPLLLNLTVRYTYATYYGLHSPYERARLADFAGSRL